MKPLVIDDAYLDSDILDIIALLQKEEYRKRYEDALLKVMEAFIVEDELTPDEQWEIIRIFADLRRDLREIRKPDSTQ